MKKPTIAVTGQKKGRLADGYNWKLGTLVFDKEEPRSKKPVKMKQFLVAKVKLLR